VRDQSLGTTLTLGFVSLLLMLAGIVSYVLHGLSATRTQRQTYARELLPARAAAVEIALDAARSEAAIVRLASPHSSDDLAMVQRLQESLSQAAQELSKISLPSLDDSYLSTMVQQSVDRLQSQTQSILKIGASQSWEATRTLVDRYLHSTSTEAVELADRLADQLDAQANKMRAQFVQRDDRLARTLFWAFGFASLVGIFLAVYSVRLITEPIGRLSLAARAVEKGDYSMASRLYPPQAEHGRRASHNEIAALGRAFAHMARGLEERETRLFSQAERLLTSNRQLEGLQALTDVSLTDLPTDEFVDLLLQRVITGVGGQAGAVFLADPASGELQQRAARREGCHDANAGLYELARQVVAAGRLVVCERAPEDPGAPGEIGVAAYLATPIRVRGEVVGTAQVAFHEPQTFSPTTVNLLHVFTERLERALERSRAVEELEGRRSELERQVAQQQQQLLRSERTASIGLLGGGIAHELRNPLGVISNAVYFLRHHTPVSDSKALRHMEIIDREVRHSVKIIDNLVDYSDQLEPSTGRLDLNAAIRSTLEYYPVPETVVVEFTPGAGLPSIVGDESQFVQAVEHIIRNAVQAMESKGRLAIATGTSEGAVWASFQDTGPGVPPENQSRIFEPLMSTRTKGMGLGLAIVKKIVEAHGGTIRLESDPGQGARFILEAPLTEKLATTSDGPRGAALRGS
jgi:signal transduction histidine kinase/HAMP domain-containing protein